jgi:membrane-associated phospholipid phosphatase
MACPHNRVFLAPGPGHEHPGRARAALARRSGFRLPRDRRDFARQLVLWAGFGAGYEVVRALADRGRGVALANAEHVIALEHHLGGLFELDLQRWVLGIGGALVQLADWTYWLSQFAVLGAGLLWIYIWRNHAYLRLRNTLFIVNTLGLVGYLALPTMPPRLLAGLGFIDTVSRTSLTFSSDLVNALANPYAAMPSLHAADALVLGIALASVVRSRPLKIALVLWPAWVAFSLLATGNHYWLDVAAGALVAVVGVTLERITRRPASWRPDLIRRAALARADATRTGRRR